MRSTVSSGRSRSVSRVPGRAAAHVGGGDRRLVEHDRGDAGGELRVLGIADREAGHVGDQVAHVTSDHIPERCRSRGLQEAALRLHIRARMAADVTIFAALFAGLLSFLSPCVLPLVPPYLVYLAGTSLERLADAEPDRGCGGETVGAALPVRGRLLDHVRRARRERQRVRLR